MRDVPALGLEVRAGVHTGECERLDGKLAGIAVAIEARIAFMAKPGEILVSGTVQDLVAGSPLVFEDRGAHELKGVPGSWRIAALLAPARRFDEPRGKRRLRAESSLDWASVPE